MQLPCSQIGNQNFISKTKQNFMTEWMTHSVPYIAESRSMLTTPVLFDVA